MEKRTKTICVYSPKGGTGKSGIVMSLGGILSLNKKRVLLVDFDLFNGSLCMLVNEDINKTIYQFSDDFNNNRIKEMGEYTYKYNDYIDVLCAPKDPRQANKIDSKYVDVIINSVNGLYDYVIFDTSCDLNEFNILIMDAVDEVLFVMVNDVMCAKNIRNILNIFKDLNINKYKVLLNNAFYKNGFFGISELKKIIDSNIDYVLSNSFYIKEFNKLLYENKIAVLNDTVNKRHNKDIKNLNLIIDDLSKMEVKK